MKWRPRPLHSTDNHVETCDSAYTIYNNEYYIVLHVVWTLKTWGIILTYVYFEFSIFVWLSCFHKNDEHCVSFWMKEVIYFHFVLMFAPMFFIRWYTMTLLKVEHILLFYWQLWISFSCWYLHWWCFGTHCMKFYFIFIYYFSVRCKSCFVCFLFWV